MRSIQENLLNYIGLNMILFTTNFILALIVRMMELNLIFIKMKMIY